ncbi:MAG: tRNA (adenosine(37)-N6)-threonylcarbamoyltransferase complex transferase subunit TsaD [Bryobacteraceae bacterium]|nr:tRNA (adenosine(37)-N6)-threonylcarbamoyltransferase complex transferase subunit TsaD [Bryobacteraceae bacterium]
MGLVHRALRIPGRILGIETSCDETAAAVVESGGRILSSTVASQLETHGKYGGVVPELASREHLRAIVPVVREAMTRAGLGWQDLSAIAVTEGPGLAGALLVGLTYAKSLSLATGLPLIGVNHLEGHIHAAVLESAPELPALALVVSGGHTHLFEVSEGWHYRLLGRTRDDAAGEAFDKVAKLLGFGYPGGPLIDALAPYGRPAAFANEFTVPRIKGAAQDYSFSGWKTAVLRWTEQRDLRAEIAARQALFARRPRATLDEWRAATPPETLDLLASFQHAVVTELLRRATRAAEAMDARSMIVTGGVACNAELRRAAAALRQGYPVYFPEAKLSTDNAVMIAAAAFPKLARREFADLTLRPQPNLQLAQ